MKNKIKRIVLTGGPCAGKTSALTKINENFSSLGYLVFTLPEVATLFNQAGVDFLSTDKKYFYSSEKALLKLQIQLENSFAEIAAASSKPVLIMYDRGIMDISVYLKDEDWQSLLAELELTIEHVRDERYDAIIHMCTAAKGAEQFYSKDSNKSRTEGIEKAKLLDDKLIQAWNGHANMSIITNDGSFENKQDYKKDKINKIIAKIALILS